MRFLPYTTYRTRVYGFVQHIDYLFIFWLDMLTRTVWLPDGERNLKICLFVSTESTNGRTDGQTDRQTDRQTLHDG